MFAAAAADWAVAHVTRHVEIIPGQIRSHEALLDRLPGQERASEDASATLRKARSAS